MSKSIKLNQLDDYLADLAYPLERDQVLADHGTVVLDLADGEVTVEAVLANSGADSFESADELGSEIMSLLPRNAVGEPFQSEGEG